jgi:hypothetical protein
MSDMENFKEIAEKCLAGELSGRFVCRDGLHISSFTLSRTDNPSYPYKLYRVGKLTIDGHTPNKYSQNDIIQFIPYEEMKQEQIKIDIPEGKVPVMEQTENEVVITWKEKELTYTEIYESLWKNKKVIHYIANPEENTVEDLFIKKVNTLRKLTNIRNYFGGDKPTNSWVITIDSALRPFVIKNPKPYQETCFIYFDTQEHAQMAIKMLGDELKYLFEPW